MDYFRRSKIKKSEDGSQETEEYISPLVLQPKGFLFFCWFQPKAEVRIANPYQLGPLSLQLNAT